MRIQGPPSFPRCSQDAPRTLSKSTFSSSRGCPGEPKWVSGGASGRPREAKPTSGVPQECQGSLFRPPGGAQGTQKGLGSRACSHFLLFLLSVLSFFFLFLLSVFSCFVVLVVCILLLSVFSCFVVLVVCILVFSRFVVLIVCILAFCCYRFPK